jgi:hypothetical protein
LRIEGFEDFEDFGDAPVDGLAGARFVSPQQGLEF